MSTEDDWRTDDQVGKGGDEWIIALKEKHLMDSSTDDGAEDEEDDVEDEGKNLVCYKFKLANIHFIWILFRYHFYE